MAQVAMNPAPIHSAARIALLTSGTRAKAVSQSKNPAPKRIGITGPTIVEKYGEGVAVIRGTGPLAHLFELGTREHFVTPGRRQGFTRPGKYHNKPGEYFNYRSRQSRSRASSFAEGRGEQSFVAIRFNRGDGKFYRGVGFKVGGMEAQPFIRPALPVWVMSFNVEMSKAMARVGTVEAGKLGRALGFVA